MYCIVGICDDEELYELKDHRVFCLVNVFVRLPLH